MTSSATTVTDLKRQRPEWAPWLAVVEETLRDADTSAWDRAVPTGLHVSRDTTPVLAGVVLAVEVRSIRSLLGRLIHTAARNGTPELRTLGCVLKTDLDVLTLFRVSLCQNNLAITPAALPCDADAGALEAVVALLALPFLHACRRAWAGTVSPGWLEGFCSICGAWPAFAESRGIERSRFFRCGRCGGEWHARPLRCPYCGVDDHTALVSMVPEHREVNAVIEGCRSCLGYVKTFSRLQGCPPGAVMVDDLASVSLDIAALEQGYRRAPGAGYPLDVTVTAKDARRFFAWHA
jgi:FdhE protein